MPIKIWDEDIIRLPAELRTEFVEGFHFTLNKGVVHPGWQPENGPNNFIVEWVELADDGRSGRATFDSEAATISRNQQRTEFEQKRLAFVQDARDSARVEVPALLAAANRIVDQYKDAFSDAGMGELERYIAGLSRRLPYAAADRMLKGSSLETAIPDSIVELSRRTEAKARVLLKRPSNRRQ